LLRWLRRRRLSREARERLLLALARSEESLIEAHVHNVLDVYEAVGDELPLEAVVDLYLDRIDVSEPRASIVEKRVLARPERPAKRRILKRLDR